ncbi:MAG: hypothetical protein H6712_20735 [Myxococcales bacterium]|nr:hypothetical protein [Myxococcales bacterium]MCB9716302.1 hypothetical protein [Myxococcales bacterium]
MRGPLVLLLLLPAVALSGRDERGPAAARHGGAGTEPEPWRPGPARRSDARDPTARLAQELECRRCHAEAAHEWSGSQHAGSWSDAAFQRAFQVEPSAFCQRCHAPEEDPRATPGEVSDAAASLGIGCVTCHVEPGTARVWASPRTDAAAADARAPHPIARSPAFAEPSACAGCHEFAFPDAALRARPLAMQSTISEHRRSQTPELGCTDCHMPAGDHGHRSHAFAGAYDRAMLRRAVDVAATRPRPAQVAIRLSPGRVGHAVPTGDLLRRLAVELRVEDASGATAFVDHRYLGRRFVPRSQPSGITLREEVADDRVGVGPGDGTREARFALPEALADRPVRWRVLHQRVAHGSLDPRGAVVEGQLEIAAGTLPPP